MLTIASQSAGIDLGERPKAQCSPEPVVPPRVSLPAVVPGQYRTGPVAAASHRPVTALLAQLVAGAEDMPAYRARRRADPVAGAESYRIVAGFGPAQLHGKPRFI